MVYRYTDTYGEKFYQIKTAAELQAQNKGCISSGKYCLELAFNYIPFSRNGIYKLVFQKNEVYSQARKKLYT